jgi:hypothetical protein
MCIQGLVHFSPLPPPPSLPPTPPPPLPPAIRTWAFAATTVHTNPVYAITLLTLYPRWRPLSGRVGWGALCSAASMAPPAESTSCPTASSSTAPGGICTPLGLPDGCCQTESSILILIKIMLYTSVIT